jgi:hypothetical protein
MDLSAATAMTSAESQSDAPLHAPPGTLIGLYELTQSMVYPDGTHMDEPDVPYTEGAKQVWLSHSDDQYGGTAYSPGTTLYHPTVLRNAAGLPMGTPALCAGMRCYAWYNRQSGRWEILAPALNLARIELSATLMPGDASVAALLIDDPAAPEITVYANAADYYGVGRAGSETPGHAGTLGWAIFSPVRSRWEIAALQAKLLSEGKADEAIATGSTGTVSLWWKDYATGNLADSGRDVTALNWLWPDIAQGKKVLVSYDRQEDRWTVIGAE